MGYDEIPERPKNTISQMRGLIEGKKTERLNQNADGWRYGGDKFNELVASLKSQLAHELQNREIHVSVPFLY